jgi:hypothetical protein
MALHKIYAQLSCSNLENSKEWFGKLFGRAPDAEPMDGLAEWHQGDAGFQLFQNAEHAGKGTLTLIVSSLAEEQVRVDDAGLEPSGVQGADYVNIIRLRDPDNNLVVMAEPKGE